MFFAIDSCWESVGSASRVRRARRLLLYVRCEVVPWQEMSDEQDIKDSDEAVVVVIVVFVVSVEIVIFVVVLKPLARVVVTAAKRNGLEKNN